VLQFTESKQDQNTGLEVKQVLGCFVACGVERGEAKTSWADAERNAILTRLLVTFIAKSKGRRKVWSDEGNEDPGICATLEVD